MPCKSRVPQWVRRNRPVLPGDAPLIRTETLRSHDRRAPAPRTPPYHTDRVAAIPAATTHPRKSESSVQAIVEESQLSDSSATQRINSSIYCFTLEKLWPALSQ